MTSQSKHSEGQIWSCKTRSQEAGSRLYIVKIDVHDKVGTIYLIYTDNLSLKNPHVPGGVQTILPYAPVSQKTLDSSVIELLEKSASSAPDISED